MPPIYATLLNDKIDQTYEISPDSNGLWGFSRVNLFCGSNNSGKSRFLRWMYENQLQRNGPVIISDFEGRNDCRSTVGSLNNLSKEIVFRRPILRGNEIVTSFSNFPVSGESIRFLLHDESLGEDFWNKVGDLNSFKNKMHESFTNLRSESQKSTVNSKAVYVPSIRTCRAIAGEQDFFDHTVKTYFAGNSRVNQSDIYSGRGIYSLVRKKLLGSPSDRLKVQKLEKFLSTSFFDGSNVALSPRETSGSADDLHIRIFPERERRVADLGDGLQQLVIIFAPLFLVETKFLYLFIEEPELYLHPGMQRRMMESFLRLSSSELGKDFQVFMATHSNHIVDMQIRDESVSVHRFQKQIPDPVPDGIDEADYEQDPKITIHQSQPGDFEILGDLGVLRSSVYLANCTIWVEGPSDRQIVSRYIDVQNQIAEENGERVWLEDRDYAFVLYGGSLLASWKFANDDGPDASRMCGEALIVCDGDIAEKGDREARLVANVGESNMYKIPCREIENSLGYELIRRFLIESADLSEEDLVNKRSEDITDVHLGKFVQSMHRDSKKFMSWKSSDGGLTAYRKCKLAKFAEEEIQSLDDCSEIGIEIGQRIIDFIRSKNP